jgi:Protein of unknown function (DUF3574)
MVAALLAACAGPAGQARCVPPAVAAPVVELFFGRGLPDGGEVSDAAWLGFVDEEVTPRFPDGLTILDAVGQYRAGDTASRERSKLLIMVVLDARELDARVDAVIASYKARFQQQAVLRVDGSTCVALR